ncbi:mannonate dehydratase [Endomicrobiia bacterium]|nr:mannonate dehydratase [Endomicrobiia bacterium]GHT63737.1 mannonate dehydratase [Endomicrobiia bacterium]GHT69071.1 mannonate dehydratase [Endomicrobiia bacterium]GHT74867.1 mannonate dehydratase [Endomicrobiia bacterium]
MQITFRWYGEKLDTIPLSFIKQIPGVKGIVWALHDMPAGEHWEMDRINQVKDYLSNAGFNNEVVESVNVHEDIKLGLPSRKKYIENYKNTLKNLGKAGVKVVCYNFMPVFDWTRTDLYKALPDGSTALFYEKSKIDSLNPYEFLDTMSKQKGLISMPGWEKERLSKIRELFKAYEGFTIDDLFENAKYFLQEIIPVAEESGIRMAIHPDDPPWSIFGLPRLITSKENILRYLGLVNSSSNGVTFCTGSLGSSGKNDMVDMIKTVKDKIFFAHIRNVKRFDNGDFIESSHRACDGSLDIVEIVRTFCDIEFKYYIRPDHGRHIWNEESRSGLRPGYGLYDRALGIMYLLGIWDTLNKQKSAL